MESGSRTNYFNPNNLRETSSFYVTFDTKVVKPKTAKEVIWDGMITATMWTYQEVDPSQFSPLEDFS